MEQKDEPSVMGERQIQSWVSQLRGRRQYQYFWWRLLGWAAPIPDPSEEPHQQTVVNGIEIDTEIVPLIRQVWALGIVTYSSCQSDRRLFKLTSERAAVELNYHAHITVSTWPEAERYHSC